MKTLLISATEMEIKGLLTSQFLQKSDHYYTSQDVDLLISGIGLMETAFRLSQLLISHSYDRVINVGIAGSYKTDIRNGDLVEVVSEQYGDLGAEEQDGRFLPIESLGLSLPKQFSSAQITTSQLVSSLRPVHSISVNTVAGTLETIEQRRNQFNPDIENMEGLAVFRIAKELNIEVHQIRCISNPITPRNKDFWEIEKAISNLNQFIIDYFRIGLE